MPKDTQPKVIKPRDEKKKNKPKDGKPKDKWQARQRTHSPKTRNPALYVAAHAVDKLKGDKPQAQQIPGIEARGGEARPLAAQRRGHPEERQLPLFLFFSATGS